MSDTPLDRLQDEVAEQGKELVAQGKDIRELQTWRDEMMRWRDAQSGSRGHMITWGLMLLTIIAEVIRSWGK